jgi:hypothetical protein
MTDIRTTSETSFPFDWPGRVCYFELNKGNMLWIKTRDETREAVRRALTGKTKIYAAWPGQYRTDLFLVDNVAKMAEALKIDRKAA